MKNLKLSITYMILLLSLGCSVTKNQKTGDVEVNEFSYTFQFDTIKSIIIVPVEINGVTKNFVFDTGAGYSLIQRDTIKGNTLTVTGASNRKTKLGNENIESFKIGTINFRNTYAVNGDMVGLKEQIPNFGGIIGVPIINKANWLIDYPNKRMTISSKDISDSTFQIINIKNEMGLSYTIITINGKKYKAIIDLGSANFFSIPKESKLAKEILKTYDFKENKREIFTLGGLQAVTEKKGIIPIIELGNIKFANVPSNIRNTVKINIGNKFLHDHILYIDNIHNNYKLKKSR